MPYRPGLQSLATAQPALIPRGQIATLLDQPDNALGVDMGADDYAAQTNAAISRADWERYKETYQPLEDLLLSRVGNQQYNQNQISQNLNRFNQGFGSSVQGYQRNLKRYGLTLNPNEQMSFNRMVDQSKTLGQVETINRTTRDLQDQELGIIGAGTKPTTYNREG